MNFRAVHVSNFAYVNTILSPSFRVTMAFFQLGALPACLVRWRRNLPRTFSVLTLDDLDLEQLLHRLADLRLVRAGVGHDGVLVVFLALARALFGQAHGLDNFKSVHVIPWSAGFELARMRSG